MALKGEEKFQVSDCSLGDWITLGYQASRNMVGSFYDMEDNNTTEELYVLRIKSDLNFTTDSNLRSYPESMVEQNDYWEEHRTVYRSSIEPNGKFRAVCVNEFGGGGSKVFLCDRIIQIYINFDKVQEAGLIDNTFKIETSKFKGTAQIMSYEETQKYLPILKEISTDYRYDLGIPALSHELNSSLACCPFNHYNYAYDCLEMTRDIINENDEVRYIADYEKFVNNTTLFLMVNNKYYATINIPNHFPKSFLGMTFDKTTYRYENPDDEFSFGTETRSAIRPLLYLEDEASSRSKSDFLDKDNYLYGCKNNI